MPAPDFVPKVFRDINLGSVWVMGRLVLRWVLVRTFFALYSLCSTSIWICKIRVRPTLLGHITSEHGTTFGAVSGNRKQTTYAFVFWRVARNPTIDSANHPITFHRPTYKHLSACESL